MKYLYVLVSILLLTTGCEESIKYKYQDKEMAMNCPNMDNALLKEALYSFENDIAAYYNNDKYNAGSAVYFEYGYANFIFPGASGTADYQKIVSPHTAKLIALLKKDESLWNKNGKDSKLNYDQEFVKCLISNIQNPTIKERIETLLDANYFTPAIMAELYRVNIGDALDDKNFALFIALETYYQNLIEIDFSNMPNDE